MEINKNIKIELLNDDGCFSLEEENLKTETSEFLEFSQLLAKEHLEKFDTEKVSILEKLEILCHEAREHIQGELKYDNDYHKNVIISVNGKLGLDKSNPKLFDEIWVLANNYLLVIENKLCGVMDFNENEILPIKYEIIYTLGGKFFAAELEGKTLIYTFSGEHIFQEYDEVTENFNPFGMRETFYWARKGSNWALYNSDLKQLIPCILSYEKCEVIYSTAEGDKQPIYIMVHKDGKCGMICNFLSYELIPLDPDIQYISHREKNFIVLKKDGSRTAPKLNIEF